MRSSGALAIAVNTVNYLPNSKLAALSLTMLGLDRGAARRIWQIWRWRARTAMLANGRILTGKILCQGNRWHCLILGRSGGRSIFSGLYSARLQSWGSQPTGVQRLPGCR